MDISDGDPSCYRVLVADEQAAGLAVEKIVHDLRNVVLLPLGARIDLARRALRGGDVQKAEALLVEMTGVMAQGASVLSRVLGRPISVD